VVADECKSETNPVSGATIENCRPLGLKDGRLQGCKANQNCFSSSTTAAGKYAIPWSYAGNTKASSSDIWEELTVAVELNGLKILQNKEIGNGASGARYMLAAEKGDNIPKQPAGCSLFYEFVIRPSDKLVVQRAIVDKTVMLYPLQQPVGDFGALIERLDKIRGKTGLMKVSQDPTYNIFSESIP
jgi:hypothetical protein